MFHSFDKLVKLLREVNINKLHFLIFYFLISHLITLLFHNIKLLV